MPTQESESCERARRSAQALSRWNNEGGAGEGGLAHPASTAQESEALPLTNAERQLELARDVAAYISPRPGCTPHRLTIHAAARMIGPVEEAARSREPHFEAPRVACAEPAEPMP